VPRRCEHPRRLGVVEVGGELSASGFRLLASGLNEGQRYFSALARPFDRTHDFRHVAGAQDGVDLGNLGLQLIPVTLAEAAGDDQPLAGAAFLELRELEDGVDRLFFRGIDEGARVDDEHLGLGRVRGQCMSALLREPHHDLGVDQILRTAEGDETYLHKS
jgi:hypothetical protein